MKIIKGKNQFALVVSKQELRFLAASVGITAEADVIRHINKEPDLYGNDRIEVNQLDVGQLFRELKKPLTDNDK